MWGGASGRWMVSAPIVGVLLGDTLRFLVASALVVGLGLLIGFRPEAGALGVMSAVGLTLLFAFSLSWVWITLALILRTPAAVNMSGLLVIFPLSFVSNVFVDPTTMPDWLQAFVEVNPVSPLATAARGLIHDGSAGGEMSWVLTACAVLSSCSRRSRCGFIGREGRKLLVCLEGRGHQRSDGQGSCTPGEISARWFKT